MYALLLPALFVPGADAEPPAPPRGAAPQFAYVKAGKGDTLTRTSSVMVPYTVTKDVIKVVCGKKVIEKVTVTEFRTVMVESRLSVEKATFSTAAGKKLDREAALKALATPQMVLISSDGKPVDASYLRAVKPGTLVIVGGPPTVRAVPLPLPLPPRPIPPADKAVGGK